MSRNLEITKRAKIMRRSKSVEDHKSPQDCSPDRKSHILPYERVTKWRRRLTGIRWPYRAAEAPE